MTAARMMKAGGVLLCMVAAIAFWILGRTLLAMLLVVAGLAWAFTVGPPIVGRPERMGRLPEGVTAAEVKEHRRRHGTSIAEAVEALSREPR